MGPRLKLFIPLLLFGVLALFLFRGLELDPQAMPSALIDRPLPEFRLPSLGQDRMLSRADVTGQVGLLNVWATWCVSCRVEHPYLQLLADSGVPIYGLNYKDDDADALTRAMNRLCDKGRIQPLRYARRRLFLKSVLDRFLAEEAGLLPLGGDS